MVKCQLSLSLVMSGMLMLVQKSYLTNLIDFRLSFSNHLHKAQCQEVLTIHFVQCQPAKVVKNIIGEIAFPFLLYMSHFLSTLLLSHGGTIVNVMADFRVPGYLPLPIPCLCSYLLMELSRIIVLSQKYRTSTSPIEIGIKSLL